jgi:hypothetical protein
MKDDLEGFYLEYVKQYANVSLKQMQKLDKKIDRAEVDDLMESNVCWLTSENVNAMLSLKKKPDAEYVMTNDNLAEARGFIDKMITNKYLILVHQDEGTPSAPKGHDHHFCIIGNDTLAYILENVRGVRNSLRVMTKPALLDYLTGILDGTIMESDSGVRSKHFFEMDVFGRKFLSKAVVTSYLKKM